MTPETISKIKGLSITQVAEKLGFTVVKKKALCFSHDDRTPSLNFDEKKGRYRCYVCDVKGDVINLVEENLNLPFVDACAWLINQFQLVVTEPYRLSRFKKANRVVKYTLPVIQSPFQPNPDIYEWLVKQLTLSQTGLNYLTTKRGFSREVIEELDIRDITDPITVFNTLKEEWGTDALLECGLCKIGDNNIVKNIWWDYVIIFPFADLNYRIQYLQGRRLNIDRIPNKYINLSNIRPYVYNIHILTQLNDGDQLYICEGIPDTITAMHLGLKAIGVLGASNFDSELVTMLMKYRIGVMPDADTGGQIFMDSVRKAFNEKGKTVQKYNIPKPYNDLNEYFITKDC
ncbi:MAG: zinc finger, CHC2-family protein [Mucilaginibacter sp.]|nr:zinc finger, CHC2-family protein [Mucilaginibacter sp.]